MKKRILKAVIKFGIIAILSAGAIYSVAHAGRLHSVASNNYVTGDDARYGKTPNHNQTLVRD